MIATVIGSTGLTGSFSGSPTLSYPSITGGHLRFAKVVEDFECKDERMFLVGDLAELPSIEAKIRGEVYFCCLGHDHQNGRSKENFRKSRSRCNCRVSRKSPRRRMQDHSRWFPPWARMRTRCSSTIRSRGGLKSDCKSTGIRSLIIFRPALLVGSREEFRLAERIATKTLVPLSRLLPRGIRKFLITDVETLTPRMLAEGKAAPMGVRVILAKDI